jgi:hypothetical protein
LDRKILPRAGGFEDQPELQMKVFMLLDDLLEKLRAQQKAAEAASPTE